MFVTKRFTLITWLLFSTLSMSAQTVKVKKENSNVKGEIAEGYAVELEGTLSDVNTSFVKFLKIYGKPKQSEGILILAEPVINSRTYTNPVFAVVKDNGKTSTTWIGIKTSAWPADDAAAVSKELEKMLYDFGVKFYRDKIQVQIDETNRAYQAVEKQKQRLVNENKTLLTKIEDNKREKIQLEKALANNKLENELLLKKIEKNKLDQDSVALAGEQIKKVTELHKERQRRVN
jgi:hypothetical protein